MRAASTALANLINSGEFDHCDVYTITMAGGGVLRLSTGPQDIQSGSEIWPRKGPIVIDDTSQQRGHWKTGLDVDNWTLTLAPRLKDEITGAPYPDKIGSQPMLAAILGGAFDSATVLVQRAFFDPSVLGPPVSTPLSPYPVTATGFVILFLGMISDVEMGPYGVAVTIVDKRQLLRIQMPRNIYQAGCIHTLYDSGCKLDASAFKRDGTITFVDSRSLFNTNAPGPAGSGTFALGRVIMTSGANAGLIRTIKNWDFSIGQVEVIPPFPYKLNVGDTGSFYPGCNKTMATCTAFGNLVNFGGTPFIPPPTASA
jgi:hypothetical protein